MRRTLFLPAALVLSLGAALPLGGCANNTLTGAGAGAAAGGLIGSLSGNFGWGALIGTGVGAAGGYLYDQSQRRY